MSDLTLQSLINAALNGTATPEEESALEARLLEDVAAQDQYLEAMYQHAALRSHFSEETPDPKPEPETRGHRNIFWGALVGGACGMVLLLIHVLSQSPVATVTDVVGAYREDGAAYVAGESVDPGMLSLSRGLLRLDFSNGATLTLEGPAELEVIDDMRVALKAGVVTATIPEPAIGFTMDTASAQVVDLGTSFGISVGSDGLTEVCVFDGEVAVSRGAGAEPQRVTEGQAVQAARDTTTIDSVAYKTETFENAWPINAGVLQTTGAVRFVSPGPDFHPGSYRDNEHIVVFPERREFVPEGESRVDLIDPGEFAKSTYEAKPILKPGRRLTSYLLQLNAFPEGKNPNRRRSVRGQITFAKPIAGVITNDRLLIESETVFGLPGVDYPSARMIEPRPAGDLREGFDRLVLAADRRTLIIELQENPGHLDQVRVLVESD